MRSYGQYCALAKALDLVGDRWSLLIIRELLIRGSCRYTDLRAGLPGIATNLLVDRLRELERDEIVSREEAPPPVAATLFQLTARGRQLETAIYELGKWGAPQLRLDCTSDVFQTHWIALPLKHWLADHEPDAPPIEFEIHTGEGVVTVKASGGVIETSVGASKHPDARVEGQPEVLLPLLAGKLTLKQAKAAGLKYSGAPAIIGRLQPMALRSK